MAMRRRRPPSLSGLAGSRSQAIFMMAQQQQAAAAADQAKAKAMLPQLATVANQTSSLKQNLQAQIAQAESSLRASGDPGGFALLQQLSDVGFEVDAAVNEVLSTYQAIQTKTNAGSGEVEAALTKMKSGQRRAQQAMAGAAGTIGRIQAQAQASAQAAAAAAAAAQAERDRIAAEAQAARDAAQAERDERARQDQLRWDREQALRQEERSYQQQIQSQQQAAQAAQIQAAESARQGEMEFQRMLLEMEQRRQERQEEQQAQAQQQAQLMQKLMFMQELGIQPSASMLFPGAAPPPQPVQQPGFPAGFGPGPFGPVPGVIQGYGAPAQLPYGGVPGMPIQQPGYLPQATGPGLMPYAQSGPVPYGAPSMMMTSFNPGAELFGLGQAGQGNWLSPGQVNPRQIATARQLMAQRQFGRRPFELSGLGTADQPATNPRLKGGLVEQGYNVYGPSEDAQGRPFFSFESPDGRTWTEWATKVVGKTASPVLDPNTGRIIYAPPPGGEAEVDYTKLTSTIRDLVGTGVTAYRDVTLTREQEKAARSARRRGLPPPPPMSFGPPPASVAPGGVPTWAYGIGALAIGAGIAGAIASKKRRKK
jgi:hypothetical protein